MPGLQLHVKSSSSKYVIIQVHMYLQVIQAKPNGSPQDLNYEYKINYYFVDIWIAEFLVGKVLIINLEVITNKHKFVLIDLKTTELHLNCCKSAIIVLGWVALPQMPD